MKRKLLISIIGFILLFCITTFADVPFITMNTWYEGNLHHSSLQGIEPKSGTVVWYQYLGAEDAAEVSGGEYLGINNGLAYAVFNGSVYVLDPQTGNILLVNSDFQGWGPSWAFSSSGKLYMCGWYGPDFYVMGSDGQTISRVENINSAYYRPYSMYFTNGNNIRIVFEGCDYSTSDSNYLDFDVTKYFGVIEQSPWSRQ